MDNNLKNVTDFRELVEFIVNDLSELSQQEIARRVGFAPKTLYSVLNGIEPGKKVRRLLKGFTEKTYGVNVEEVNGKLQVVKKQIFHIQGDFVGGNLSEDFQAEKKEDTQSGLREYLLRHVIELEEENKKLKIENELLKSK